MHADSAAYLKKYGIADPMDVYEGEFPWREFLQAFLQNPGVAVNDLHPIVGLRHAGMFVELMLNNLASPHGPKSVTFIRDGVRKKGAWNNLIPGSQWWFWDRDLRRLGKRPSKPPARQPRGSGGVANPEYERGRDQEGIVRRSSNHVAQKMPEPWGAMVGYATDLGTSRGRNDAAWAPIHKIAKKHGLEWPLKAGVSRIVERWHHQAQDLGYRWYPGPFPKVPGVHRPIIDGFVGGDVAELQVQLAEILGLKLIPRSHKGATPAGAIRKDGHFGPKGVGFTKQAQAKMGRPQTGVWTRDDQLALRKPRVTKPKAKPAPAPKFMNEEDSKLKGLRSRVIQVEREVKAIKAELG